jgi:hypothetical protein
VPARFGESRDKIELITYDLLKDRKPDLVVSHSKIAISHSGGLLALALKSGKQYVHLKRVIVPKAADKLLRNLLQRDASLTPYKKTKSDASGTYGSNILFPVINGKLVEI